MKKIFSLIIATALFLTTVSLSTSANGLYSEIDTFLLNSGVPEEVVNSMPLGQKEMIYDDIGSCDAEFCGYDLCGFSLNGDTPELTGTASVSANGEAQPLSGLIPNSDLELSVVGFKSTFVSGEESHIEYSVFPSFVWKRPVKIVNDSFAMSMYSGWEAIPGKRNLRIHLYNYEGQSVQHVDLNPSSSNSSGYSYKIPSGVGFMQGMYQGHAVYHLLKKSSSATPAISLYYAHDTSSSSNSSYSINLGSYGSISMSGNTNKVQEMSDNFIISME